MTGPSSDWVSRLNPIPNPDSSVGQLAQELRKLSRAANASSLTEFAESVRYSKAHVSEALSGRKVPAAKGVIEAICTVCSADEPTRARLREMRAQAIAERDSPKPPPPPPPWYRRLVTVAVEWVTGPFLWWKVVVTFLLLAALVSGAAIAIKPLIWCGEGFEVRRIGAQCIGVTTGRVALRDDLADVLGKIRDENERVDHSGQDAVSVAYLVSLPAPSSNDELAVLLRRELEGAYVAQWQANHTMSIGDKPMIRLLVANDGDGSGEWQRVVPDVLDRVSNSERLVTAVVTGRSLRETVDAIDHLREGGIPVIASRLTGDILTNLDRNQLAEVRGGLARVAPTNSDQTTAAAAYLKREASRAVLVQDVKPGDPYIQSLGVAFRRGFEDPTHHVLGPPEPYNSGIAGVANTMGPMLRNICQQKPDVVFFAGRTPELGAFVQALPGRPCPQVPVKIVAGADAVEFASEVTSSAELRDGLNANASMIYTTQAHPGAWTVSKEGFNLESIRHFGSCDGCYTHFFPSEPLDDGAAIMGYDAIVTAVIAIRPGQGGHGINDRPELVSQQFNRLHGTEAVGGASGWISLTDGRDGSTVNKAVALLQVTADGSVKFLGVSSADGSPCVPDRTRC